MPGEGMKPREIALSDGPAKYYEQGTGEAILLIHGGWGGAEMHWAPVFGKLASKFRVIAPDLPGLGNIEQQAFNTVAQYASWLVNLLDELQIERASCVGNSFGATVAWSLAGRFPERCQRLVLVNGVPMPRTPPPMLWIGKTGMGEALMRGMLRRASYTPGALSKAFSNGVNAPSELCEMLDRRGDGLVPQFARLVISGDGPPEPKEPALLLWGKEDMLPGTNAANATRISDRIRCTKLVMIPHAGHFPQIEKPDDFVKELFEYLQDSVNLAR